MMQQIVLGFMESNIVGWAIESAKALEGFVAFK